MFQFCFKSGQSWYFLFSAKLNSESGKMLYTKVVNDFISFQQYKDGHHMIQVAQDMPSASYCIYAERLMDIMFGCFTQT